MTESETSPRTVRLLTAVLLVATFAVGVVTGVGLCHWIIGYRGPPPPPPMMGPIPAEELGLSSEQRQRVREIMDRYRPELEAVLHETYPRVRTINERMEKEVRSVLNAEQQARLDDIRSRRPPPPPPGAPPPGPPPPGAHPPRGWGHPPPPPGSGSAGWPWPPPFPPGGPGSHGPPPEAAASASSAPDGVR